jgi:hypothetical protein
MADTFQEATFGFRFLCLSEPELSSLRQLMPAVRLTVRPRAAGFVVSFDLPESFDLESLCSFIADSGVDARTYSVWISVICSGDQGGVEVPAHVLKVMRRTSGGVDISFASCLGDAPSEST